MERIAAFEKVSFEQFRYDMEDCFGEYKYSEEELKKIYDEIKLPERSTAGSAGYDFRLPVSLTLSTGAAVKIPTGIRCHMNEGWFLMIVPRSGLGFKYYLKAANTVGIIDSDYYYAKNDGHIMVKVRNEGALTLHMNAGDAFCQGIFLPFGITDFDNATAQRTGGFGSTGS